MLKFQKFCFLPLPTYTDNYGTRSFDGCLNLQNIESSGTWVFEHALGDVLTMLFDMGRPIFEKYDVLIL